MHSSAVRTLAITPEIYGMLALGEGSHVLQDGSSGRAFVSGGGLMGGASALWAPSWLDLGYLYCVDHWHLLTFGLTFSFGI